MQFIKKPYDTAKQQWFGLLETSREMSKASTWSYSHMWNSFDTMEAAMAFVSRVSVGSQYKTSVKPFVRIDVYSSRESNPKNWLGSFTRRLENLRLHALQTNEAVDEVGYKEPHYVGIAKVAERYLVLSVPFSQLDFAEMVMVPGMEGYQDCVACLSF